jgi:hypothetical protein
MRQPDDPGLDPLDPPDPFEDPFAGLKSQTWVRVYLILVFLGAIAWAAWSVYASTVHE